MASMESTVVQGVDVVVVVEELAVVVPTAVAAAVTCR
jgi:hypothetical protein